VMLRLDAWPDSGCPMLYYVVEYVAHRGSGSSGQAKNWVVGKSELLNENCNE
jgi:hypothetical protein